MSVRLLLAFLLISGFLFSVSCIGVTDNITIRALDAKYRPIEGALVNLTYDLGNLGIGGKYTTTNNFATNSSGEKYFVITILNKTIHEEKVDCKITAKGAIGGGSGSVDYQIIVHPRRVDLHINVYPVDFLVKNQNGISTPNASITVGEITKTTGSNGKARFYVIPGKYDYFASYSGAKRADTLTITGDTYNEIEFGKHSFTLKVYDDLGNLVSANVTVEDKTTEIDGTYHKDEIIGDSLSVQIVHEGIEIDNVYDLQKETEDKVVFDSHAPNFVSYSPGFSNGIPQIVFELKDSGIYASGVNPQTLEVVYRIPSQDNTLPWNRAIVFATAKEKYTAQFPNVENGKLVMFKASVKDRTGNIATLDGKFQVSDNTENNTDTHNNIEPEQGIPLIYIVVGVLIVFLAIFIGFRTLTKTG